MRCSVDSSKDDQQQPQWLIIGIPMVARVISSLGSRASFMLRASDVLWIFVSGQRTNKQIFRLFFFILIFEFSLLNALPGLLFMPKAPYNFAPTYLMLNLHFF